MGFDGKSIINPRQINIVHEIFTPTQKDIIFAEKVVKEIDEKKKLGIGVFTVDGKMIDIAFYDGAKRTIELAKASGVYKGICKMINAVGRDIPEEILEMTGKEVFRKSLQGRICVQKGRPVYKVCSQQYTEQAGCKHP